MIKKNFLIVILLLIGCIGTFAKKRTEILIQELEAITKSQDYESFDSICSKYKYLQSQFDSTSLNYAIVGTYYADFLYNKDYNYEALSLINKCAKIYDVSKKQHEQHIRLLLSGYRCSEDIEDIQMAKKYIVLAKSLCESYHITGSLYAEVLRLYANYCEIIHSYDEEEKYLFNALNISEQLKDTLSTINVQLDLSWLYYFIDYDSLALEYSLKTKKMCEQYTQCPIRSLLKAYNAVGVLFLHYGEYSDAISLFESILGKSDLFYSQSSTCTILQNLGYAYFLQGNYEKALQQFEKVYAITKKIKADDSNDMLLNRRLLSMTYFLTEQQGKAYKISYEDFELRRRKILTNLVFLLEEERIKYWQEESFMFEDVYPNLAVSGIDSIGEFGNLFYDCLLLSKGLLLSSSNAFQKKIMQSSDIRVLTLWNNYCKTSIAIELEKEQNAKAHLKKELQSVEELLMQYCLQDQNALLPITTSKDVAMSLQEGEAAIEFAQIHDIRNIHDLHAEEDFFFFPYKYYALILLPQACYPIVIPIETVSDDNYIWGQNVWESLLPYFNNVSTIYFSPSGALHQMPLEYFPFDSISTMSDHFDMVRLSSTREIVAKYESATIYGGIVYNVDTEELIKESKSYEGLSLESFRGIDNDTLNRGTVKYLPGTMKEAETINTIFADNHVVAQLYSAKAANEESFKALNGRHQRIIHIATHGFTWSDSIAQNKEYFTQQGENGMQAENSTIDPMSRCGLLFAGANTALSGHSNDLPEGVQDGILTAKEISMLDLRDCDLVVLSACETGKGDISSEGVFGLQRAFKMAGVQTIIMSLWKVDDNATQMLMTEFYRNWIEKKQSRRQAFKNAQNVVRKKYEEPGYWAGFIMLD